MMVILREIYLDNAATTRTDPDTAQVALDMMINEYGNPSSLHRKGLSAQLRVDRAREQAAALLDCGPEEVIFTSGGTEANNMALLGAAAALRRRGDHIVCAAFEHASVLSPVKWLERQGFRVTLVPPSPDGSMDISAMAEAVEEGTVLAACMLVNSETGSITDIPALCAGIRRRNKVCHIHCDAVQALGKIPFSARELGADSIAVSAHKLYAPKGAGALYLRKGARILPAFYGGSQERGLRPGTENTALICAFGCAAEKAAGEMHANRTAVERVCEYFVNKCGDISGLCMNSPGQATPYIRSVSVPGYRSEVLLHYLEGRGIYVSGGSACSKGARSHVLAAMGLPPDRIDSALRISFSKHTTPEDIDAFFEALRRFEAEHKRTGRRPEANAGRPAGK